MNSLRKRSGGFSLSIFLLLSACSAEAAAVNLKPKVVTVGEAQTISVQFTEGELVILGDPSEAVHVSGKTLFPGETDYRVITDPERITVVANYVGKSPEVPLRLRVRIPNGSRVVVEARFASMFIQDFDGELQAATVSGNVSVENFSGSLSIRSNWGNISVRDSEGLIEVIENSGQFLGEDLHGDVAITSKSGGITYSGEIGMWDALQFVTEDGPVSVNLDPDSNLSLLARSESGEADCNLPELKPAPDTCEGTMKTGRGLLIIHTLGGPISVTQ